MTSHWTQLPGWGLASLGLMAAVGCGPAPMGASETKARLDPLLTRVASGLTTDVGATFTVDSPSSIQRHGDRCTYQSDVLRTEKYFGVSVPWEAVRQSIADGLRGEGFTLSSDLEIPGGWTGFDAVDERGAALEVRAKTWSTLSFTAEVSCDGVSP